MSMKGPPGVLMASVLAASTAVLASTSGDQSVAFHPCSNNSNEGRAPLPSSEARAGARSSTEDAFAPRFNGLKFVEMLVTAHR